MNGHRTTRALMLLGTCSDAGKSTLVAGLCRLFHRRGLRVVPFKPQNMSNNAAAVPGGGEIGRAQALQAQACGRLPSVDMNPILLKPQQDNCSEVVIHGKSQGVIRAGDWRNARQRWMPAALESFNRLQAGTDLILVEGAGSPAETNLRDNDVANLGFARASGTPAILVGDIDRGGVIASVVGTHAVLDAADRRHLHGFVINRLRGDPELFTPALATIQQLTGWTPLGVVPWLDAASALPREDALQLPDVSDSAAPHARRIAIPVLSRIANFDDFAPLSDEPGVSLRFIPRGQPLPRDADLIILPGSRSTTGDLDVVRAEGWDIDILAHVRQGGKVFGVCGGFQMLGERIDDPDGLDGAAGSRAGLGLLPFTTRMQAPKITRPIDAHCPWLGCRVRGYEIHLGRLHDNRGSPMLQLDGGEHDGLVSADGLIGGCHLHGLFLDDAFRRAFLRWIGAPVSADAAVQRIDAALDAIASTLETTLDIDALLAIAGGSPRIVTRNKES